jgi:hypothetical protein
LWKFKINGLLGIVNDLKVRHFKFLTANKKFPEPKNSNETNPSFPGLPVCAG